MFLSHLGYLAQHYIVSRWSLLLPSPFSDFNIVAHWFILNYHYGLQGLILSCASWQLTWKIPHFILDTELFAHHTELWGLILKMTLIIDSKNKRGIKRFLSIFTLQLNKLGVPLSYPEAIFGLCYKPRLRDIMCTVQCPYCWFHVPGVQWNSEALVLSLILNGRLKRQSLYL